MNTKCTPHMEKKQPDSGSDSNRKTPKTETMKPTKAKEIMLEAAAALQACKDEAKELRALEGLKCKALVERDVLP